MSTTTRSLLAAGLLLGVRAPGVPDDESPPDRILTYKTVDGIDLRLHVFLPGGHRQDDPRPAIVFFFGGGWRTGSPNQFFPQARRLAARGMVAISADYRVATRHGTTPVECVRDGTSAVRWIRLHAGTLGIDPERLAAGGGSAGGHVAAATAFLNGFDEDGEDRSVSARPDALVLFNPVIDNSPEGFGNDRVGDDWERLSPLHNIRETPPPTAVFLGTNDRLVPVDVAGEFQRRIREAGGRCDLFLYEGEGHGFFNVRYPESHAKTLRDMEGFLESIGYLDRRPNPAEPDSPGLRRPGRGGTRTPTPCGTGS